MTNTAHRPLLLPLVPLYRLALALRELEFRSGLKPVRRLRWPVVSIGSLSAGGAGKTPLTIALARALAARGLHVDVLSRGYGRRSALPLLVDPRGTADDFGDEPLLIARESGTPVYVAAGRYQAGLLAESAQLATSSPAVHLLDDGFQHRQLHRDVDILLMNRADLCDRLLPAGNLREPLRRAARAQIIAIPADEADLESEIRSRGWSTNVWRLHRRMQIPPAACSFSGPVAAFCGIARPAQYFQGLESAGVKLAARIAFPDHHRYTARDLDRITAAARAAGAVALLTTEKDHVRLGAFLRAPDAALPLHAVPLRIEIDDEAAALAWLLDQVRRPQSQT